MFWHIVGKVIRCLPCNLIITRRRFRTTQGADTPEDKALQDHYIESLIKSKVNSVLGFYTCPKCRRRATICDE